MSGEIRITINGDEAAQFLERLSGLSASINSKVSRSFNQGALKSLSRDVDVAAKNLEQATKGVESLHDTLQDINGLSMGLRSFSDNVGKMAASVKNLTPTLNRAGQVAGDVATDVNKLDALLPKLEEMLKNFSGVVNDGAKMSGSIRHGSSILLNDLVKDFHKLQNTAIQGIVSLGDPSKLARVTETANQVQEVLDAMAHLQHKGLDDEERAGFALRLQEEMKTMLEDTKRVLGDEIKKGEDIERLQKILEKGSTHMRDYSDKAAKSIEQGFDQLKNLQLVSLGRSLKELPKSFMEWKKDRQLLKQQAEKGGEEAAAANQAIGRLGTTGGLLMGVLTGIISVLFKIDAENAQLNQGLLKFGALGLGLNKGGEDPFKEWRGQIRKFSSDVSALAAGSGKFFIPEQMVMAAAQSFHTSGVAVQQLKQYGTDFDSVMNSAAFLSTETGLDINRVAALESEFLATYRQGLKTTEQTIYTIGKQANTAGVSQEAFWQAVQSTSAQTMLYRNSLLETSAFLNKLAQTAQFAGKKGLEAGKQVLDHLNQIGDSENIGEFWAIHRNELKVAVEARRNELSKKTNRTAEEEAQLKQAQAYLNDNKGMGSYNTARLGIKSLDTASLIWVTTSKLLNDPRLAEKARNRTLTWAEVKTAAPFLASKSDKEGALILEVVANMAKGKIGSIEEAKAKFGPQLEEISKQTKDDSADQFNSQNTKVTMLKTMLNNWLNGNSGITGILTYIKDGITKLVNLLTGKTEPTKPLTPKEASTTSQPGFVARQTSTTSLPYDNPSGYGYNPAVNVAYQNFDPTKYSSTKKLVSANKNYLTGLMFNQYDSESKLSESHGSKYGKGFYRSLFKTSHAPNKFLSEDYFISELERKYGKKAGSLTEAQMVKERDSILADLNKTGRYVTSNDREGAVDFKKLFGHVRRGGGFGNYALSQDEQASIFEMGHYGASPKPPEPKKGSEGKPPMRTPGTKGGTAPGGKHEVNMTVVHKTGERAPSSSPKAGGSPGNQKSINTYGRPGATTGKVKGR